MPWSPHDWLSEEKEQGFSLFGPDPREGHEVPHLWWPPTSLNPRIFTLELWSGSDFHPRELYGERGPELQGTPISELHVRDNREGRFELDSPMIPLEKDRIKFKVIWMSHISAEAWIHKRIQIWAMFYLMSQRSKGKDWVGGGGLCIFPVCLMQIGQFRGNSRNVSVGLARKRGQLLGVVFCAMTAAKNYIECWSRTCHAIEWTGIIGLGIG
jgi:hypothetical protein